MRKGIDPARTDNHSPPGRLGGFSLPRVASEMALHVLAYNLTRVMNIMGTGPLIAAMRT
jgi:hypothetical protein